MAIKYRVTLTPEERTHLEELISTGSAPARTITHARILLKADATPPAGPNWDDAAIQAALDCGLSTIHRVRQLFVEVGLDAALHRRRPPARLGKLDGEQEAHLIALACGDPPTGRARWSLRLLADRFVALGYIEAISYETIRVLLKKNELKPWLKQEWCIPPHANAEFVYHMEDVLDLYTAPADPMRPLVCFDESPYQRISDTRTPLPTRPGEVQRYDHEYARAGVDNLFMFFAPFANWRRVKVTAQRTKRDFAECMRELVDEHFPAAEKIRLVLDNLNTHRLGVLYEVFAPAEAKRICEKLEVHYTPKHGSWLNMAEIELAVLKGQCLDQRIGERARVEEEAGRWAGERNDAGMTVNWRFTTADARIKLKRLYPQIEASAAAGRPRATTEDRSNLSNAA